MASRADVPAAAIQAVDAPMRKSLGVVTAAFAPGALTRDDSGDRAAAGYTARFGLSDLGAWSYSGRLTLIKSTQQDAAGQRIWQVQFSPAAIQPRLAAGRTLERTRIQPARGRLLDDDGIPLRGADSDLDSNLLGVVGPLTAEQAKAAGPPFEAGDISGQTGIERVYNAQLAGRPGGNVVLMRGAIKLATLFQVPAVAGRDVKTTIDLRIQRAGESALASQSLPAALVAIDTRTGGVTGIVNHPPAGFGRAIRARYPPGSTFKVVTATAALLAGKTETSTVNCPKTLDVSGFTIKNAEGEAFGQITFKQALALSCNTAFVNLRQSITESDMEKAAQLYGFNGSDPLPITSFGGSYPKPTGPVDEATSAFGQAAVEASPLQMASVVAAVAAGKWRQPFVAGRPKVTHTIPANVDGQLKDMLRAVVTEGTAQPVGFPGVVYGKTRHRRVRHRAQPARARLVHRLARLGRLRGHRRRRRVRCVGGRAHRVELSALAGAQLTGCGATSLIAMQQQAHRRVAQPLCHPVAGRGRQRAAGVEDRGDDGRSTGSSPAPSRTADPGDRLDACRLCLGPRVR